MVSGVSAHSQTSLSSLLLLSHNPKGKKRSREHTAADPHRSAAAPGSAAGKPNQPTRGNPQHTVSTSLLQTIPPPTPFTYCVAQHTTQHITQTTRPKLILTVHCYYPNYVKTALPPSTPAPASPQRLKGLNTRQQHPLTTSSIPTTPTALSSQPVAQQRVCVCVSPR